MLRKTGCEPSFRISDEGWAEGAVRCPSTHSDERPAGSPIDLLVIHNISLPPGEFGTGCVQRFFTDRLSVDEHPTFESLRDLHVASHFLIERTGTVTQFLPCTARGWHAGISSFEGRSRCNDFSIGIEVEGTDFCPFEEAQYASLVRLARASSSATRSGPLPVTAISRPAGRPIRVRSLTGAGSRYLRSLAAGSPFRSLKRADSLFELPTL